MTNLEAYFRIYGIKIAQETFPKKKPIEPVGISPELELLVAETQKAYKEWKLRIGMTEEQQGKPTNK